MANPLEYEFSFGGDPNEFCLGWIGLRSSSVSWIHPQPAGLVNWYDPEVPPLTWGPAYKEADGRWAILAACPIDLLDLEPQQDEDREQLFTMEYRIGGGPSLWETVDWVEGDLVYSCRVEWRVAGYRLSLPILHESNFGPTVQVSGQEAILRQGSASLRIWSDEQPWELARLPFAIGDTIYQHLFLQGRGVQEYRIRLR